MSEQYNDYDKAIGLDKFEKLLRESPVLSDSYEGKHRYVFFIPLLHSSRST